MTDETPKGDPAYIDTTYVRGPTGSELEVANMDEKVWYETTMAKYLKEYQFENIADLQDLDRLLGLELLTYRYMAWTARGKDYDDLDFAVKETRDHKQKIDQEIRLIKKHMGMDRKGRVESEQESVGQYLQNLLRRAHQFGVHRNNQVLKALDLFNDLKMMVGLHERCDEEERRELGVEIDDIWEWIVKTMIPEYDAIDAAFRKEQRAWIQEVG